MRFWLTIIVIMMANASQAAKIGLVLPFDGRFAQTSNIIRDGVSQALQSDGGDHQLVEISNDCDVDAAPNIAEQLAGARFVIGPLCFSVAKALAEKLKTVPMIMLDARSPLLNRARSRDGLALYDVGTGYNAEANALLNLVIPQFDGRPYAIIDDGSVHGRSLADAVRLTGEEAGTPPIAADTFRPFQTSQRTMLRRLNKSGVEAIFIAGGPEDAQTIISDLRKLKLDWRVAVGDQAALLPLMATMPLPDDLIVLRQRVRVVANRELPSSAVARKLALSGMVAAQLGLQLTNGDEVRALPTTVSTVVGERILNESGVLKVFPYETVLWGAEYAADGSGN